MIFDKYHDMISMTPVTLSKNMAPTDNMMPKANMANASCIPQETVISNVRLARAYVPFEKMCSAFTPLTGLKSGTIFPPLMEVSGWERGVMGVADDE